MANRPSKGKGITREKRLDNLVVLLKVERKLASGKHFHDGGQARQDGCHAVGTQHAHGSVQDVVELLLLGIMEPVVADRIVGSTV